jgi:hypothetical protein
MTTRPSVAIDERTARILRLPVWAQREIQDLERRALAAEAEAEAHRAGTYGDLDTDTVADPYGGRLNLPKGEVIEFVLDVNGPSFHRAVRANISKPGVLRLNADRGLFVSPVASNDVEIRLATD